MLIKRDFKHKKLRKKNFGQNSRNKIFLKILNYNGVCLKNFQRMEQRLAKAVFCQTFHFLKNSLK